LFNPPPRRSSPPSPLESPPLGAVLVAGNTLGDITDAQWVVIVGAVLAAGYGTYQTPNKPPTPPTVV
jgi:hypothetical protein